MFCYNPLLWWSGFPAWSPWTSAGTSWRRLSREHSRGPTASGKCKSEVEGWGGGPNLFERTRSPHFLSAETGKLREHACLGLGKGSFLWYIWIQLLRKWKIMIFFSKSPPHIKVKFLKDQTFLGVPNLHDWVTSKFRWIENVGSVRGLDVGLLEIVINCESTVRRIFENTFWTSFLALK